MSAPETNWTDLLGLALPALRHVFGPEDPTTAASWTMGGGTALAIWLDHRISYDVDLFVPSVPLRRFLPTENPGAAAISSTFQWPGHYLKFETPMGEIDFLSPHLETDPGYVWTPIGRETIPLETVEEIVVKKIRYRSARLTARDAFDIAAAANARPDLARVLAHAVPDALPRALEALDFMVARRTDLAATVRVTATGRALLRNALDIVRTTLAEAIDASRDRTGYVP